MYRVLRDCEPTANLGSLNLNKSVSVTTLHTKKSATLLRTKRLSVVRDGIAERRFLLAVMNSEQHQKRGVNLIRSSQVCVQEYWSAMRRESWNLAVRRAQEAVELVLKGAICKTGTEFEWGHKAEPLDQLKSILKQDRRLLTEFNFPVEVPTAVICHPIDDTTIGYGIQIYKREIMMAPHESGGNGLHPIGAIETRDIPESEFSICIHEIETDAGPKSIIVECGGKILASFNELGGMILVDEDFVLGRQLSEESWKLMRDASVYLAEHRCPSFYHDRDYSKEEAKLAGDHMQYVQAGVRAVLGGPSFNSDPELS